MRQIHSFLPHGITLHFCHNRARKIPSIKSFYRPPTEWRRQCFQSCVSVDGESDVPPYRVPPQHVLGPHCTVRLYPSLDMFKRFQDLTVPPSTDTFKLVHNEARTVGKHPIGMLSFFILILASFKQTPKKF